jgi:hypothetical protein
MKITSTRQTDGLVKLLFITLALTSFKAEAFTDSRVDKWEFFLAPQFTNSKVLQFEGGAEADINDQSSLGFGFGYNLNANIELDVLFSSSNANYTITAIPENPSDDPIKSSTSLYTSTISFGFTYNLVKGPFTPYVSANLGYTYIDSGIPTGNIGNVCYWYPYYGYVCGPVAETYTSTEFNYGAGIGLRYDFNRKLYIKGDVSQNYLDINSSNTPDFTTYRFIFGFMF